MAEKRMIRHYFESDNMQDLIKIINDFVATKNVGNILDVQQYDRIVSIKETTMTNTLDGDINVKHYNYIHEAIIIELVDNVSTL